MDDHPLYGKRKKKKETSANPLFVEWLTEWKEEAAEKGWKSQYTYGKVRWMLYNFEHFWKVFSFCSQLKCWLSGLEFIKCLSE